MINFAYKYPNTEIKAVSANINPPELTKPAASTPKTTTNSGINNKNNTFLVVKTAIFFFLS